MMTLDAERLTSFHKERYGKWGGQPNGVAVDPSRCAEEVHPNERGALWSQCSRKRGHGPEGAFCKQHSPEAKAARNAKADRAYKLEGWRRHGRESAMSGIATAAIAFFEQRGSLDDIERAVNEYQRKAAEIEAMKAEA